MKILILTSRYPLPEMGGDYLRINSIARYLRQQGHEIILLSLFHRRESQEIYDTSLYNKTCIIHRSRFFSYLYTILAFLVGYPMQICYFFSFRFLFNLKRIIREEKPDRIIPHLLRMTEYLHLLGIQKDVIVEATDALSKTYKQCEQKFTWKRFNFKLFLYTIEQKRMEKYEKKMIAYFPKISFVSQDDIAFEGNQKNLFCYPNGVNVFPGRKTPDMNKIVFLGNMRSLQNEDAALYFISEIFPLIRKKRPQTFFHIAGANPSQKIQKAAAADSFIKVTGYIEDIDNYIADAALSVAPIRYAAGIQNKVLFSMAHSIPVVVSPLIAHGIPELQDGINCFICSSPQDFANACLSCLQRDQNIIRIEKAGYDVVNRNYSWNSKLQGFLE